MSVAAPTFAASPTCADGYALYDSNARGRFLSGNLLSLDLDGLAEIRSAHAEATEGTPWELDTAGLAVDLLSFLELDLTGTAFVVSDILTTLTDQDLGALNQFAYANEQVDRGNSSNSGYNGTNSGEVGASGTLNNSTGAANFAAGDEDAPSLGNVNLRGILETLTGDNSTISTLVSSVTDLNLDVGALFGRADMDVECVGDVGELVVDREYLVASLKLLIESAFVGDIVSALSATNIGAGISDGILDVITNIPLIGDVVSALEAVLNLSDLLNVEVTVDLDALTGEPIVAGPGGGLTLDLQEWSIVLDLEKLVNSGLNGHAPNTRLFVDAPLLDENAGDGGTPLQGLLDDLVSALTDRLLEVVSLNVQLDARILGGVTSLVVDIQGTLGQLLGDSEGASASVRARLAGLTILDLDASGLTDTLGDLVDVVLEGLLGDDGVLGAALDGIENGILIPLFTLLDSVIVLTVNAQNDPEVGYSGDASALPDPPAAYADPEIEEGRYDVSALYVGVIDGVQALNLSLARGSVGPNVKRA